MLIDSNLNDNKKSAIKRRITGPLIFHRGLFQILAHVGDGVFFLRKLRLGGRGPIDDRLIGRGGLPGVIVRSPRRG